MFISIKDFIHILLTNNKHARMFVKKNKHIWIFENMSLADIVEIADIDFSIIEELMQSPHIRSKIALTITWEEFIAIKNNKLATLFAQDIKFKYLVNDLKIDEFIKLIKSNPTIARALCRVGAINFQHATMEQLLEIFSLDKAMHVILKKAEVQKKLISEMQASEWLKVVKENRKVAYFLMSNKIFCERIMQDDMMQQLTKNLVRNDIGNFLRLFYSDREKSIAALVKLEVKQVLAEKINAHSFYEFSKLEPIVARLLAEKVSLQKKLAEKISLKEFIQLAKIDRKTVYILYNCELIRKKIEKEIIEKRALAEFIDIVKINHRLAKEILDNKDIRRVLTQEMTSNDYTQLAEISLDLGRALIEEKDIQENFIKEMTIDGFIQLIDKSQNAGKLFFCEKKLKENFCVSAAKTGISLDQLIKLAKVNPVFAQFFIDKRELNIQLNSAVTFEQLIELIELDEQLLFLLLENKPLLKDSIEKLLTIDNFIELARINERVAVFFIKTVMKQLYDPANMLLLMKKAPLFACKLSEVNKSIAEICVINDMPKSYSELMEISEKKSFASTFNLKGIDEYHPIILFLLGKTILNRINDALIKVDSISIKTYIEAGRLFIGSLHSIEEKPSESMCIELALLADQANLQVLSSNASCRPRECFFSKSSAASFINNYENQKKRYHTEISNLFATLRTMCADNTLYQNSLDLFLVDRIYTALKCIDANRYATLIDKSLEKAIKELNYQNENLPSILLNMLESNIQPQGTSFGL